MLSDPDLVIGVAPMEQFLSDPISDILVERGAFDLQGSFEGETKINIFVGSPAYRDYFPHNYGCTILVETLDDLRSWENKLLSAPILLDAQCKIQSKRDESTSSESDEGYWAVVINTRNLHIRHLMEPGFEDAKTAIQERKRYMLEFDFREVITDWFRNTRHSKAKCNFAKLRLTNHMFFEDLNRMLCGYEKWIGAILGVLCCPCIMCGVCVNMFRLSNRQDTHIHVTEIIQELQLTMHKEKDGKKPKKGSHAINDRRLEPIGSDYGATDDVTAVTEKTKLLE